MTARAARTESIVGAVTAAGELIEGVSVLIPKKHATPYRNGFVMTSLDALASLALDTDLKLQEMRVLLYLMSRLDYENFIYVPQRQIAEMLNIAQPNVSKALKKLKGKGVLIEGPNVERARTYRLNPNYGWRGKVKNLHSERAKNIHFRGAVMDYATATPDAVHKSQLVLVLPAELESLARDAN